MDNLSSDQKFKIGAVILVAGFLLVLIGRYWMADYLYQKGMVESQRGLYESAVKDMQSAIDLSPTEAIYHNQMARIFTDVALGLSKNNATSAAQLVPYAINESDIA